MYFYSDNWDDTQEVDMPEKSEPKTMEFERLCEFLHPKFICDHLRRVWLFLKCSATSYLFGKMSPCKEAFLSKLVTDKQNLLFLLKKDEWSDLSRKVIEELENNKNVYIWVHSYSTNGELKYSKAFLNNLKDCTQNSSLDQTVKDTDTKSIVNIKSLIDFDCNKSLSSEELTSIFKSSFVMEATQIFCNDVRLVYEFPSLTVAQADYVQFVISSFGNCDDSDILQPLREAMKLSSLQYRFVTIIADDLINQEQKRVILRKISNNVISPKCRTSTFSGSCSSSSNISDQKKIIKRRFKSMCVKFILKLMDSKEEFVEFPPMKESHARYLKSLISSKGNVPEDAKILKPLTEAFLKFNYDVSIAEIDSGIRRVVLHKLPKADTNNKASVEFDNKDINTDTGSLAQIFTSGFGDVPKRSMKFEKLKNELLLIPLDFKLHTIETVLDFLENEKWDTFEFMDLSGVQAKFVRQINVLPFKKNIGEAVETECMPLIRLLRTALKYFDKSLTTKCIYMAGNANKVTLSKTPKKVKKVSNKMKKKNKTQETHLPSRPYYPTDGVCATEDEKSAPNQIQNGASEVSNLMDMLSIISPASRLTKALTVTPDGNCAISSVATTLGNWKYDEPSPNKRRNFRGKINERQDKKRKIQLLEAMSVPVESNKAKRMMHLMGWQGGALGKRGNGITEPLMPAITHATGSGLGHNVAIRNHLDIREDFEIDLLEFLFDFVKMKDVYSKEFLYKGSLISEEKELLRSIVTFINKGIQRGSDTTEKKKVFCQILDIMDIVNIRLKATVTKNNSKCVITKHKLKYSTLKVGCNKPVELDLKYVETDLITDALLESFGEELQQQDALEASARCLKNRAIRVLTSMKLLNFIKSDNMGMVIVYDMMIPKKIWRFHIHQINNINKRLINKREPHLESAIEKQIMMQILNMNPPMLQVDLCQDTKCKIIIQKVNIKDVPISANCKNDSEAETVAIEEFPVKTEVKSYDEYEFKEHNHEEFPVKIEKSSEDEEGYNEHTEKFICTENGDVSWEQLCSDTDLDIQIVTKKDDPNTTKCEKEHSDQSASEIHSHSDVMNDNPGENESVTDVEKENLNVENVCDIPKENAETNIINEVIIENLTKTNICEENCSDAENVSMNESDLEDYLEIAESVASIEKENMIVENMYDTKENNENTKTNFINEEIIENFTKTNISEEIYFDVEKVSINEHEDILNLNRSATALPELKKKIKFDVTVMPELYPMEKFETQHVSEIQTILSDNIDEIKPLPLLKYSGLYDGIIKYKCKNYQSYNYLKTKLSKVKNLNIKLINNLISDKLLLRFNFKVENVGKLLKRLNVYNPWLKTDDWVILDERFDSGLVLTIQMDRQTARAIVESGCSVYAGVGKGYFTVLPH